MRKAAELLAGRAAVVQVNVDESPHLASRFGVSGVPVVHLLVRGSSRDHVAGAQSAEALVRWFRSKAG